MECLSEETVFELVHGRLDPERLRQAEAHLADCAPCRRVVAESAKGLPPQEDWGDPDSPTDVVSPRVGRYTLRQKLGAGGMGVVHEGYDPQLHRRVALKLMRGDGDPERLLREARAMAQLAHPNVVTVYDAGTYAGGVFIAMELVEGLTLGAWLERDPRPTPDEILRAFEEAGRGLDAAHAQGIVHRDFKPDNVLLGADGRTRVSDFGLARTPAGSGPRPEPSPNDGEPATRTASYLVGTPAYMAPEQFLNEPVGPRTDQFAFCVALHEALYGARPFVGKTHVALAQAVTRAKLRTPRIAKRIGPEIFAVIRRGLSRLPGDRFASMGDLVLALAAAAEQARARGAPTTVVPALSSARWKSLRWVLAGGLAALIAAGGLVAWRWPARLGKDAGSLPRTTAAPLPLPPSSPAPSPPRPAPERSPARHSGEQGGFSTIPSNQGTLRLRVPKGYPPLSITLDGEPHGQTPRDLYLPEGSHRLTLTNPAAHILIPDWPVEVRAGHVSDPIPALLDPHPHAAVAP